MPYFLPLLHPKAAVVNMNFPLVISPSMAVFFPALAITHGKLPLSCCETDTIITAAAACTLVIMPSAQCSASHQMYNSSKERRKESISIELLEFVILLCVKDADSL